MEVFMIFVMGATGKVGSKVVAHLLENGQGVRCLARHFPNKELFKGAELVDGDANNVALLSQMMRGCQSVLTMIPEDFTVPQVRLYQNKLGEAIAEAIEEANITKVVHLSYLGAELPNKTGLLMGYHDQEERLNKITHADIIHLRPAYFMENLLATIPDILSSTQIFGALSAEVPVSMIATQDVAARVAFLLMAPHFEGRITEPLLGQRDLSMNEVAQVLGHAIKKTNLDYFELSPPEMTRKWKKSGYSEDACDSMLEYFESLNNGSVTGTVQRSKLNTTATSLENFAQTTFAEAYRKAIAQEIKQKSAVSRPETRP
jgi:uncharacterized protein YbjT (DUF2867 family)